MNSKRKYYNNQDFGPSNKIPRATQSLDIKRSFYDTSVVTRRPANFTRPHPSKATAKDRKKARRILKRHVTAPITEDQVASREDFLGIQEDIEWAKAVLPNFLLDFGFSQSQSNEATRENLIVKLHNPSHEVPLKSSTTIEDDGPSTSSMKVQSPEPNRASSYETTIKGTFAEIARGRRIIGLIDNGNFEGKIPRNQWDWIQASLASVALEVLRENPGPPPSCTDAGWFQGNTKLIACDTERSALLYKWAIAKIGEVYPGARLEVVDIRDIPSRPWATAWLPETPSESEEILEMLNTMNPELPIEGWKVIKADKFDREMMMVIFQINRSSIEHLTRCDGLLNYRFNKIRMKFYKTAHDALSNLEAFAAAVDLPTDELDELETNKSHLNEDLSFLSDCLEILD